MQTIDLCGHVYELYQSLGDHRTKARAKVNGADWFRIGSSFGAMNIGDGEILANSKEYDAVSDAILTAEYVRKENGKAWYLN